MTTALLSLTFLLAGQPTLAAPATPPTADSTRRCEVPEGVTTLTVEIAVAPGNRVVEVDGGHITRVEFGPVAPPRAEADPLPDHATPEATAEPGTAGGTAPAESDAHRLRVARWANAERRVRQLEERLRTHTDANPRDPHLVQLRGELSQLADERDHWESVLRAEGWTPPAVPIHTTRLVVGPRRITIDGLETTWKEIPRLMRYWPDRRQSTLLIIPGPEVATRSEAVALGQRIQTLAEETYFQAALLDLDAARLGSREIVTTQSPHPPLGNTEPTVRPAPARKKTPTLAKARSPKQPTLAAPSEKPAQSRPDPNPVPRMEPPQTTANQPPPPQATTPSEPAQAAASTPETPTAVTSPSPYRSLLGMHIERLTRYLALLEEIAARVETERGHADATAVARREALRLHQHEFASLLAAAEQEYIRSVQRQSAIVYPTDRQLSWSDLVEILTPARDRLLELGNRFDAHVAATSPAPTSQLADLVHPRLRVRRFVRLVDGSGEKSLDGVPTDPKELSRALTASTGRGETVLEIAVSPQRTEALDAAERARIVGSFSNLAGVLDYEEVDDAGTEPLGSLGSLPQVLIVTSVCPEHGRQADGGLCPQCGKPTETELHEFFAEREQP